MTQVDTVDTVVTFSIEGSVFAVEVKIVQEILSSRQPTRLPNAPRHLLGLIDVRGASVPLVDLRPLLGEASRSDDDDTRIMLLTVPRSGREHVVALRVDRVIEVTGLDDGGTISPVEEAEMLDWDQRVVRGIGRREDTIVALLDVAAVFDPQMMAQIRARLGGGQVATAEAVTTAA